MTDDPPNNPNAEFAASYKSFFIWLSPALLIFILSGSFVIFPGYENAAWTVGLSYIFFLIIGFWIGGSSENKISTRKAVIFSSYAYAVILAISLIFMTQDVLDYQTLQADVEALESEIKEGDAKAELRLANYYYNLRSVPSGITHRQRKNKRLHWLETYVNKSIEMGNTTAIGEIKRLGKIYITGYSDLSFTGEKDKLKGIELYKSASLLGDKEALNELKSLIRQAGINQHRWMQRERRLKREAKAREYLKRQKAIADSKKSVPEKLGEGWGSIKKGIKDGFSKITKPFRDIYNDFDKGEKRTNR